MKGTPTMGKAKSLKEKRELAAELGTFLLLSQSIYIHLYNHIYFHLC